jgi:2-polyprenyl-3-methyl-5-hydroxy-6-metoxy-1,4-benzoquinol methylase
MLGKIRRRACAPRATSRVRFRICRFRRVGCLLCGSESGEPCFEENGYLLRRCSDCGLLYVPDPPSDTHLQDMYDREEWVGSDGEVTRDDTAYQRASPMLNAVAADGLDYIRDSTGVAGGRLLDVGTGDGHFLAVAEDRGFQAEGVELSHARAARARSRGLRVHQGDLLELSLPEAAFDLISLRDILSHVTRPVEMLIEVHRLLKPDGAVFVQTGNKAELQSKHDGEALFDFWGVPGHLAFFGEPHLRMAFARSGLRARSVRRIPYLDWQLAPRLLNQDEGRWKPARKVLANAPPLRALLREGYRWYWHRGRPQAEALWVTARAS